MDLSMLIIGAGLIIGSIVFSSGVDRLMRRMGVTPANPGDQPGGLKDLAARITTWLRARQTTDR